MLSVYDYQRYDYRYDDGMTINTAIFTKRFDSYPTWLWDLSSLSVRPLAAGAKSSGIDSSVIQHFHRLIYRTFTYFAFRISVFTVYSLNYC